MTKSKTTLRNIDESAVDYKCTMLTIYSQSSENQVFLELDLTYIGICTELIESN